MPATYIVTVRPSERNVAPKSIRIRNAASAQDAIDRADRYISERAVNHITKLIASGYVDSNHLTFEAQPEEVWAAERDFAADPCENNRRALQDAYDWHGTPDWQRAV